ncbi:MAG: formylglycine-generating enzyme family protein [Bacteriovoracales bacterium]|nr:formylglycine-generating enzyme family protein [Bacteriovoracales bacterium]
MRKSNLIGFYVAIFLITWGCSTSLQRHVAWDAGLIGPEGEVILFYKKDQKIVIRPCERYTVLKSKDDCKVPSGKEEKSISVSEFKESIKRGLRLYYGVLDASSSTKKKLEIYARSDELKAKNQLRDREEMRKQIARIERFIGEFGKDNAKAGELERLTERLNDLDSETSQASVVKEVNERIDHLVDTIISDQKLHRYIFSDSKNSFVFNLLRSYLRASTLSLPWIKIEAGSFSMGSPDSERGRHSNENRVRVRISKPFEIMSKEVTQSQWFDVMGDNPSRFSTSEDCDDYTQVNGEGLCPNHPVEKVSWNSVRRFIEKLNEREKGSVRYRLPTEAEWEFAARGGTQTVYSFGNDEGELEKYGWYDGNSGGRTHAVGSLAPNPYGLYDVHGNVWEWVQDGYDKRLPGDVDPVKRSGVYRVVRGGSWSNRARFLRSAYRSCDDPNWRYGDVGFRLVRTR